LKEAKALLDAGLPDGAYYLAGYAVECALKACIAKSTLRYDFPDKTTVDKSYTHSLTQLVGVANLNISGFGTVKQRSALQDQLAACVEMVRTYPLPKKFLSDGRGLNESYRG
jgi:HEPN domain-containing protein